jgi:hypothetical protein
LPPSRREKLQAHAEHLLDLFVGLRSTFAMLEPILFDRDVVSRWGTGKRGSGLRVITNRLLNACVLDIAKIALDKDERTPSVSALVQALDEPLLLNELRESYSIWNLPLADDEDPEVIQLLQRVERREEDERRAKFDAHLSDVRRGWNSLESSPALSSFAKMRDKFIAHSELWHNGTRYEPRDISTLGLKLGDVRTVINELQTLVDLITLIYRNSSFAFDELDQQVTATRDAFWAAHAEGATPGNSGGHSMEAGHAVIASPEPEPIADGLPKAESESSKAEI